MSSFGIAVPIALIRGKVMWSLTIVLIFSGFYLNYCSSNKVNPKNNFGVETWIKEQGRTFEYIGLGILVLALIISINFLGLGSGIFIYSILLMTIGSLVILLAPLHMITPIRLGLFLALLVTFENLYS